MSGGRYDGTYYDDGEESGVKCFNTAGICIPENNYMADVSDKVGQIVDQYISSGKYFTINRARQYGKTTTLYLLEERLKKDYIVLSLSFESADELFASLYTLAAGLIRKIGRILKVQGIPENIYADWQQPISREFPLDDLGQRITDLCTSCDKRVILLIDEVDKSSDNQTFLSFLGLLREKYLNRLKGQEKTFHSVILAGVYDVKNLKLKLHPEAESKYNSPWNKRVGNESSERLRSFDDCPRDHRAFTPYDIAVDFEVDMSLSVEEIASMLQDYESDWHTGMDIVGMSEVLYEYTSGYPFLVSRLCQIMAQERGTCWNRQTFQNAVRELLRVSNSLFDDMGKKLAEYPELKEMVYGILFQGKKYAYESENHRIRIGEMFGFLKESQGTVSISNRIFEMKLYNLLLSEVETDGRIFATAEMEKNQFVKDGSLQMELVMEKFCEYFEEIYADADDKFVEENGRRIFLMFLKPIINGNGNYYIEARTRNLKRTDVIIDYKGEQSVLELKIWHGQEYNSRGEKQLTEYLEYYHLKKGYMLSFNFNQKKQTGIRRIVMGEKLLIEAVV